MSSDSESSNRLKDVPGDNVETVMSYLKGALVMLQNCDAIPTDTMGLLNDVMILADCSKFSDYMKSIYFMLKRNKTSTAYNSYLNTVESEYRTLYHAGKWTKSKQDHDSEFYSNDRETGREEHRIKDKEIIMDVVQV